VAASVDPLSRVSLYKFECLARQETGSQVVVEVDEEDVLVKHLQYDGDCSLAVCIECKYALPLEWIKKHFKDNHKVKVHYELFIEI
jgi:hypothetical protein